MPSPKSGADIDIFTLDTGRLFPEVLETVELSEIRYGVRIRLVTPEACEVEALVARDGVFGFRQSVDNRKACCEVRKVRPLNRELKGAQGWITGIRREHSDERADVPLAAWDEERGLIKVNPIADWSTQELTAYIAENNMPVNPLHARGFISIGCQPCTRAVQPGEHPRAGRWWWENEEKKECGLHMNPRREREGRMTALVSHLKLLEAESIHIFREAAAQFRAPVLLYSIGKDSTVLLHLARKAFWPAKPPFPLLHIDTTWKFRDMIAFRDKTAREFGLDLIVHTNQDGLAARHQSVRPSAVRLYRRHEDAGAARRRSTPAASMPPSAARGATRKPRAPRSGCSRSAPQAIAGSRAASARRCGRCSTAGSARARRCASSRCRIGPRATCGATSRSRSSTWFRSISPPPRPVVTRDGQLIMVDDERMPLAARRDAGDAQHPLPHARLLAAHRGGRVRGARPRRGGGGVAARASTRSGQGG